jgi:hypothetical protein
MESHLKPGISEETLERKARARTDRQAAEEMQRAKQKLLRAFGKQEQHEWSRLPLVGHRQVRTSRATKFKTFLLERNGCRGRILPSRWSASKLVLLVNNYTYGKETQRRFAFPASRLILQ